MTVSLDFVILSMMIWLAPGDIHRCVDASGAVQFRDQPCAQGKGTVFRYDPEAGLENANDLHRWLQDVQGGSAQPGNLGRTVRARPTLVLPGVDLADRPTGSLALSTCSLRFFECTNGNSMQMDQCVSQIQSCSAARRSQCCHNAYVSRYEQLRSAGVGRHDAVRVALLGNN